MPSNALDMSHCVFKYKQHLKSSKNWTGMNVVWLVDIVLMRIEEDNVIYYYTEVNTLVLHLYTDVNHGKSREL